jgi:hypothetical protein
MSSLDKDTVSIRGYKIKRLYHENYFSWKDDIKAILFYTDDWQFVDPNVSDKVTKEVKASRAYTMAKINLGLSISYGIWQQYKDLNDLSIIWSTLKVLFESNKLEKEVVYLAELEVMSLCKGKELV